MRACLIGQDNSAESSETTSTVVLRYNPSRAMRSGVCEHAAISSSTLIVGLSDAIELKVSRRIIIIKIV